MQYDVKNPVRRAADAIDVEWNHPDLGVIPFTCVNPSLPKWSGEPEYMADIWAGLMRGDFGPISEGD